MLACAFVGASAGCNSILGNDEGLSLPDAAAHDGSGGQPSLAPPGSSTTIQDDSDAGPGWDAFAPPASSPDSGVMDAGGDSGTSSAHDAGSGTDAGSSGGCSGGLTRCGIFCVDLSSDGLHCGNCATLCLAPLVCKEGHCKKP